MSNIKVASISVSSTQRIVNSMSCIVSTIIVKWIKNFDNKEKGRI
jgi:hypothetical protein